MSFTCTTLDEFLAEWGDELGQAADRAMAPLHVPSRDSVDWLLPLNRKPYPGQSHAVAAGVKTLNRQNSIGFIWEQGSGKTLGAGALVHNHANQVQYKRWHKYGLQLPEPRIPLMGDGTKPYRALVMCPGHLPKKWKREVENTIPGVKVTILENFLDVAALRRRGPATGPEWFVIGKDRAKLSCEWRPGVIVCGDTITKHGTARAVPVTLFAKLAVDHGTSCICPACDTVQVDKRENRLTLEYFENDRRQCQNCGEPLWQDVPQPRNKYSPALFIKKHLKGFFQYLVVDESHDMKSPDSVQADAMGFLSAAVDKTITLTGTLVGGYAWHVRTTLFRTGAAASLVDAGLGWKDETNFNEKYGRIETRIVNKSDSDSRGHKTARGRTSRTVTKRVRPGIMPTLFGDHLVSSNIFLTLDEVCADLPSFEEAVHSVQLDAEVEKEYKVVEGKMRAAVAALMFKPGGRGLMSKLLQTLLAYPDYPFEWKEIGYHDEEGKWVGIVTPKNFPPEGKYAKEKDLIRDIKSELAQGRKCWVYTTMVETRDAISRLERMLIADGIVAKVLRSSVDPGKREEWIDKEGPRCQVILSHPDLVKTGLDFFDAAGRYNFPTIMFYMTGYNSFTLSQASRRAWRIMQKALCKVKYYFAKGTMQEAAMTLMGKKMAATAAVSGRFSTEGLAAMAGDDDNIEMAMAKALIEGTGKSGEALRAWDKIVSAPQEIKHAEQPATPASSRNGDSDVSKLNRLIATAVSSELPKKESVVRDLPASVSRRPLAVTPVEQFDLFSLLGDDISQYSELPV